LAFAAVSGARTFLGPALAARRAGRGRKLRWLTTLLAIVEVVYDKVPWVPARTSPRLLLGRAASGAAVAVGSRPRRGRGWAGVAALAGAALAIGSAFGTLRGRRALIRALGGRPLGNALAGAVEELTLLALGRVLGGRAPAR
jgi:uncharacterized membrane protein